MLLKNHFRPQTPFCIIISYWNLSGVWLWLPNSSLETADPGPSKASDWQARLPFPSVTSISLSLSHTFIYLIIFLKAELKGQRLDYHERTVCVTDAHLKNMADLCTQTVLVYKIWKIHTGCSKDHSSIFTCCSQLASLPYFQPFPKHNTKQPLFCIGFIILWKSTGWG